MKGRTNYKTFKPHIINIINQILETEPYEK